jgi:murein tripeptide amidase MpaA
MSYNLPAPRSMTIAIYAENIESLREIVRTHSLDFGCHPHAKRDEMGKYFISAIVNPEELEQLRDENLDVEILFDQVTDDRSARTTVAQGDRFEGGRIPPQGLGSRSSERDDEIGSIMNVDEINAAIEGLVNEYGIPTFDVPNTTSEGSGGKGGAAGAINPDNYHVYFIAGVHARERGGPDLLIYFISDLLFAQKHSTGLRYGAKSYSNADVLKALNTGIVFFPLVNPDGVRWDQKTDSLWRKNRNPASAVPGNDNSIGVDINRNYDFLWDYRRHFHPSLISTTTLASDRPQDETFHGKNAFSEAESRNVAWVFDKFPRIRWFMDIHSAVGDILFNWGDDNNQLNDPRMNFMEPAWDSKRGILGVEDYREWIDKRDFGQIRTAAKRVAQSMQSVGGRSYGSMQSVGLYPTSGASDDYAYSRFQVDPMQNKVHGFTMEFGYPTNFYPTLSEFHQNVKDTGAGLMEFCLAAADLGLR